MWIRRPHSFSLQIIWSCSAVGRIQTNGLLACKVEKYKQFLIAWVDINLRVIAANSLRCWVAFKVRIQVLSANWVRYRLCLGVVDIGRLCLLRTSCLKISFIFSYQINIISVGKGAIRFFHRKSFFTCVFLLTHYNVRGRNSFIKASSADVWGAFQLSTGQKEDLWNMSACYIIEGRRRKRRLTRMIVGSGNYTPRIALKGYSGKKLNRQLKIKRCKHKQLTLSVK